MHEQLKSLQNIKVCANTFEEENSHLQSQLKMAQEQLIQKEKVCASIKFVHLKHVATYICMYLRRKATGILFVSIIVYATVFTIGYIFCGLAKNAMFHAEIEIKLYRRMANVIQILM